MYWEKSGFAERKIIMYYVIKKLTNVTDEEADEIRQKRDAHRAKRRLKKEEQ